MKRLRRSQILVQNSRRPFFFKLYAKEKKATYFTEIAIFNLLTCTDRLLNFYIHENTIVIYRMHMLQEQTGVLDNLGMKNKQTLGNCNMISSLWNTQNIGDPKDFSIWYGHDFFPIFFSFFYQYSAKIGSFKILVSQASKAIISINNGHKTSCIYLPIIIS